MILEQKHLSKEAQLIDQNFSNEIMLNALAALENLAIFKGYKGNRIFDYYSGYANRYNEQELVNAVILQLEVFRPSHYNYALIYSNYDFPKNLTKEQIIKIIKEWRKFIHPSIQIFYNEMINYLQGYSNNSGISNIINEKREEWGPTTGEDLDRIGKITPFINGNMHREINNVKNAYNKNGYNEIIANLNGNQNDNKDMKQLNEHDQQNAERKKKFFHYEKKIESFFEKLLNDAPLSENDYASFRSDIEKFNNYTNGISPDKEEIKSKINKFNKFKKNIPKIKNYKEYINHFIQICDEIITLYKKMDPNPDFDNK